MISLLSPMTFVVLFLALVVGILLIGAIMPSRYNVEKITFISKPVKDVMDKVGDLNYYASWNPWQQVDPSSTKTITGTPQTPGS
jgi:hypothetical protein